MLKSIAYAKIKKITTKLFNSKIYILKKLTGSFFISA